MNKLVWIPLPLVLLLAGCSGGGGGSSSSSTSTSPSTSPSTTASTATFDLAAAYNQLFNGSTFKMTGTDNNGNSYTASISFVNRGAQTVNSQSVTEVDDTTAIKNTTTSASTTGTVTRYYQANWSPYEYIFNTTGVIYTPNTAWTPPASAKIGDFGNLPTFTGSDGSQISGFWQLSAASNGNATYTGDATTTNGGVFQYEEADSYTLTPTGNVLSLKVVIHYANGTIVTISGPLS